MAKPPVNRFEPLAQKYGKRYGIAPKDLLGLIDVETGGTFRSDLTSPAGAGGPTQFMPGTARQYKVNIHSDASAVRGAAQYLHDLGYSKNPKLALAKYNGGPGNPQLGYGAEVLKRAGKYAGSGSTASPLLSAADGQGDPQGGATTSRSGDIGQGADILSLLQSLAPQPQPRASAGLPAPSFSAQPTLATGAQIPQGGGGMSQQPDIAQMLAAITTPGGGIQHSTVEGGGATAGGTVAAGGGERVKGAVVGSPIAGEKPQRATHETSGLTGYPAVDYMAKPGTRVVAPVTGKVVKLSGDDPKKGATQGPGGPLGWSVYIRGNDGRTYYLTHMGSRTVKVGQTVRQGTDIGTVANYDKYGRPSHIHMGVHG